MLLFIRNIDGGFCVYKAGNSYCHFTTLQKQFCVLCTYVCVPPATGFLKECFSNKFSLNFLIFSLFIVMQPCAR